MNDTPIYDKVNEDRVKDGPSFWKRTKKAIAGGIAALAATGVGSTLSAALADGAITPDEVWGVAAIAVGAFFVGFGGVYYAPANETE